MLVSFSKNIFLQLYCRIENKIINIDGKRWRNGRHKCRCHVCGKVLDSKKDKYSPKECGWMRLKDRKIYDPWICHSCLEHYKHGKVNVHKVYELINDGLLPAFKLGSLKVSRKSLEEFVKSCENDFSI